jgi:signal transduction histidine kinase
VARCHALTKPPFRREAACLYGLLVHRAALRYWVIALAVVVVGVSELLAIGLPLFVAVLATLALGIAMLVAALGAWFRPERYTPAWMLKFAVPAVLLAYLGATFTPLLELISSPGPFDSAALFVLLKKTTPALLLLLGTMALLTGSVAAVKRVRLKREFENLRLTQERASVGRQLAEARLKLLQQQIQPHFIFNTLAAVQHWVDQADPRAGPLLRSLTSFLRGSTELLTQEQVSLDIELETVRHYLAIMQSRLGDRLHYTVDVEPQAGARCLPPGLLLTLVENAVEHGVSPAIHGGTVKVSSQQNDDVWELRVSDDGAGLPEHWVDGIGLSNCRERLHHRFGDSASLSLEPMQPGAVALVRIDQRSSA